MSQLSRKLRDVEGPALSFWCQGCNEAHTVKVGPGGWSWNGDAEKPVFGPSVLVTGHWYTLKGEAEEQAWQEAGCPQPRPKFETADTRCHTFVGCNGAAPGQIIFLGDCTHALVGQTLELADWPNWDADWNAKPARST